ncbi:MAG: hypothetical protein WBE26_03015 [Phycisphaerae bacterium]
MVVISLSLLTFLGCKKIDCAPGDKRAIVETIHVYWYAGEEKAPLFHTGKRKKDGVRTTNVANIHTRAISEEESRLLSQAARWVVPAGMEVSGRRIYADTESFGIAKWEDRRAEGPFVQYTSGEWIARGVRITINGILRINETCPEGSYEVYVELPALTALAEATGTEPREPYGSSPADRPKAAPARSKLAKRADSHVLLLPKIYVSKSEVP